MNQQTKEFNSEFAKVKRQIFVRDNFQCMFPAKEHIRPLDIDHIRKRSLRGTNSEMNLITLCRGCHTKLEDLDNRTKEALLYRILEKEYGYDYKVILNKL